ncbi:hypothetical protein SUGI_0734400 [Cryptomeria japonica]|nr:hypothetical protein SUGI_0734400 [Cryptomeria japonica]
MSIGNRKCVSNLSQKSISGEVSGRVKASMDSKQLMDSLVDHLALYHSVPSPSPSKSPLRNNIVTWMSTLSTEQRQAALTTVDESWVAIILQMQARIQNDGQGFFILLPDVPIKSSKHDFNALPSLCYRKARGLLARAYSGNQAEQVLTESVRLFSSAEGQIPGAEFPKFDSLVVTEDLVKDMERFVSVMDAISNGEFLRSSGPSSASKWQWEELPWLKDKGYYSLAAFVVNKLELSLRLSWLASRAKKRINNSNVNNSAGNETAANVFWRKKGCVRWWSKVDSDTKATAFKLAVAKAAKFEANQLVRNSKDLLQTKRQGNFVGNKGIFADGHNILCKVSSNPNVPAPESHFESHTFCSNICKKHSCGCNFSSGLYILQEVSSLAKTCTSGVPEDDKLFFTSLSSAHTVLDNVLRRVRQVFVKVSKDSVELDLLGEENTRNHLNQQKAKDAEVQKREKRRKGRTKKKKFPMSKQNSNVPPKQLPEDASVKQMPFEEQVKMMNTEEDSRKGNISSLKDLGMAKNKLKKENLYNLACQGENKMSPCRLQNKSKSECSVSGMGESQIKSTKQGRGRSKLKKKGNANLDTVLLSDDKERTLADCFDQPQQQIVKIQQSSLQNAECGELIDSSGEDLCSRNINIASSLVSSTNLCSVDNKRSCSAEQSIICCDKISADVTLSNVDFRVNHDSNCGSSYETECLISLHNSHALCKSDSSGIEEDGKQMGCSPKSIICQRGKEDAIFLSRDCKSSSGFVEPLKNTSHCERMLISATDLNYHVHHGKQSKELDHEDSQCSVKPSTTCSQICNQDSMDLVGAQATPGDEPWKQQRSRKPDYSIQQTTNIIPPTSYEWPGSLHICYPSTARHLPATTDRLHLDVDWNWRHHSQPSYVTLRRPTVRNSPVQVGYPKRNTKPQAARKGSDSSPVVQTGCNLTPSIGYSLEPGFTPFFQSSLQARRVPSNIELNGSMAVREGSRNEGTDDSTCDDLRYLSGDTDDFDGYFISEDEAEKLPPDIACNSSDYNHVFGGGVMYWNTADYAGTGYSGPPSLSSEDSSWARHEDELKLVIEDITSLPGYNGGVASPPTTFHSSFDPLCSGMSTVSAASAPPSGSITTSEEQDNRSASKRTVGVMDGIKGEVLPHPILRPIVIPNMSNQRARNDLHVRQSRSPCVPCNRRELPRLKRPPSPMVLCVPPAPSRPPPSSVGGLRKQRRFPTVRSGSSSPRNWGISGWSNEAEMNPDEFCLSAGNQEVVNFAWRRKCIPATPPMHSLPGALLRDCLVAIPQLALEQEHPDLALPLQSAAIQNNPALQASVSKLHNLLHDEIESFCKQVAYENSMRKPFINAALERVSRALQVLWPRSRTKIFGSIATGLALPTSDVDLVVCLPPVRNLEPIKEAGILEGRNGIKETCLQHAARYLADQEWVKSDSLKTIENTAIPIIMLVVKGLSQTGSRSEDQLKSHTIRTRAGEEKEEGTIPNALECKNLTHSVRSDGSACETKRTQWCSKDDRESVHLDISFESPSHTGLKTANLVRELVGRFPAVVPLALILKQFLTDRSLDHSYSGGLSSYCLVLLITRFIQHEHHAGRAINQNLGSLFMDFLYFFGCVFDPRQMRVSIYGSGMYVNRDRGQSIDPLHIDDPIHDPLHQANNVGRNCFRIHQCIKAFSDAHSVLEKELVHLANVSDSNEEAYANLLEKTDWSIG